MDDSYLTKLALKEVKRMEERKQQELECLDDKVIYNFIQNIDYALIDKDIKKIASIVNSFALYVNTMIDLKENRVND